MNGQQMDRSQLTRETVGDQTYEFLPLSDHVVCAPGFCHGRPTFKYTRVEVAGVLELLAAGHSVEEIAADFGRPEITREAILDAVRLAVKALSADWPGESAKAA